jgi:hypothetical protein
MDRRYERRLWLSSLQTCEPFFGGCELAENAHRSCVAHSITLVPRIHSKHRIRAGHNSSRADVASLKLIPDCASKTLDLLGGQVSLGRSRVEELRRPARRARPRLPDKMSNVLVGNESGSENEYRSSLTDSGGYGHSPMSCEPFPSTIAQRSKSLVRIPDRYAPRFTIKGRLPEQPRDQR